VKQRLLNILFWSIISAAFIGPGTVTTAAAAGSGFGYSLIWALVFSTVACFVLQEASARLTAVTGMNLGQAIKKEYSSTLPGKFLLYLSLLAILSGCAAFEAGNILGAAAGIKLLAELNNTIIVLAIGMLSFIILWAGTISQIAKLLGVVVALMGICFAGTAIMMNHEIGELLTSFFVPSVPEGAEILVLGLIGTTVVPYNIFLGSGLKHSQSSSEMRLSLMIAIGLGGLVSISVLLTGTAISGAFTFDGLSEALSGQLGGWAGLLLGIGLCGAGLSSTLTAALAASITAKSLLASNRAASVWNEKKIRFRSIWISVLVIGMMFGILDLQPVPIIILAQALNGIILPVIAVILFLLMNNSNILPSHHQNGNLYNLFTGIVVYSTVLIGLTNLTKSLTALSGHDLVNQPTIFISSLLIFAPLLKPIINRK